MIVGGDKQALEDLRAATGYPDVRRLSRARIESRPAPRWPWPIPRPKGEEISVLLMGAPPGLEARGVQWIPDFQEHRFPNFFPPDELAARYRRNTDWFARHRHVMVSSEDVAGDVRRYYGGHGAQVHVVRFASFVPAEVLSADVGALRARYGLPERYFICNNQLWRHKNHRVILSALAELKGQRPIPPVVLTGKEADYRDPDYAPSLRRMAAELGVQDQLRFLGFLPRTDQLGLMKGALAVIQPSLCEGWSTVIEDAKALGRHVLASDIAVHREQLGRNADLFGADAPAALARLLDRYAEAGPQPGPTDYAAAKQRFAKDLERMIADVDRDLSRRRALRLMIKT